MANFIKPIAGIITETEAQALVDAAMKLTIGIETAEPKLLLDLAQMALFGGSTLVQLGAQASKQLSDKLTAAKSDPTKNPFTAGAIFDVFESTQWTASKKLSDLFAKLESNPNLAVTIDMLPQCTFRASRKQVMIDPTDGSLHTDKKGDTFYNVLVQYVNPASGQVLFGGWAGATTHNGAPVKLRMYVKNGQYSFVSGITKQGVINKDTILLGDTTVLDSFLNEVRVAGAVDSYKQAFIGLGFFDLEDTVSQTMTFITVVKSLLLAELADKSVAPVTTATATE